MFRGHIFFRGPRRFGGSLSGLGDPTSVAQLNQFVTLLEQSTATMRSTFVAGQPWTAQPAAWITAQTTAKGLIATVAAAGNRPEGIPEEDWDRLTAACDTARQEMGRAQGGDQGTRKVGGGSSLGQGIGLAAAAAAVAVGAFLLLKQKR